MFKKSLHLLISILMLFSLNTYGTLIDRGNGLIYDDILDITWADPQLYRWEDQWSGISYDDTWSGAVAWADQLVYQGYDDWRLPTTPVLDSDCSATYESGLGVTFNSGLDCTGGEMSHLFYELGGVSGVDLVMTANENLALFPGIDPEFTSWWWSSPIDSDNNGIAFVFEMPYGGVAAAFKDVPVISVGSWAVRDGDVAQAPEPPPEPPPELPPLPEPVPVPAAVWLFASGLIGLIGMGRRKAA